MPDPKIVSDAVLGRLGVFITKMYKNSSLAKSPCVCPDIVETYEDYSTNWASSIDGYVANSLKRNISGMAKVKVFEESNDVQVILNAMKANNISHDVMSRVYKQGRLETAGKTLDFGILAGLKKKILSENKTYKGSSY